ncbi:MAG: hypothetical protein ACRES8_07810 [Nevskiaceae bacterium]
MSDLPRDFNHSRFQPGTTAGFYESYFQRANHPTRPLAFWIRYTIFCPKGRPHDAIGELWAIWFDGERNRHSVAKSEFGAGRFVFGREEMSARIGDAVLEPGGLQGAAESRGHRIAWDLSYSGDAAPLFLLPPGLYAGGFPKAKTLVGLPMARYDGTVTVDGAAMDIEGWRGSQNHNWGVKHTDRYAWGQVAGFDNAPDSFLEVATGQLKIGPAWTPRMTPLVLRHEGEEFALRSLWQAVARARGSFGPGHNPGQKMFHWDFASRGRGIEVEGRISAPKDAFVGLRYHNPPGGAKQCLNSKIASCRLQVRRAGQPAQTLETTSRAAFEILTDDLAHGIEIRT